MCFLSNLFVFVFTVKHPVKNVLYKHNCGLWMRADCWGLCIAQATQNDVHTGKYNKLTLMVVTLSHKKNVNIARQRDDVCVHTPYVMQKLSFLFNNFFF